MKDKTNKKKAIKAVLILFGLYLAMAPFFMGLFLGFTLLLSSHETQNTTIMCEEYSEAQNVQIEIVQGTKYYTFNNYTDIVEERLFNNCLGK